MPTFEAITLPLMLVTVAERIAEAILEFVNAHLSFEAAWSGQQALGGSRA